MMVDTLLVTGEMPQDDFRVRFSYDVLPFPISHFLYGFRVDVHENPVNSLTVFIIDQPVNCNRFLDIVKEPAVLLLALPECLLGPVAIGNIEAHAYQCDDFTVKDDGRQVPVEPGLMGRIAVVREIQDIFGLLCPGHLVKNGNNTRSLNSRKHTHACSARPFPGSGKVLRIAPDNTGYAREPYREIQR